MYSQHGEQEVIVDYFNGTNGRFLDIGSYNGKTFSNIYKLMELGWNGVCIEPSFSVFKALIDNTKQFNVKLINGAVSPESNIIKFFDSNGDALSTSVIKHRDKWKNGYGSIFHEYYIKTITLQEVFDTFGYDFKFINIDIEGCSYELFLSLVPFIKEGILPNLTLICIEHDYKSKEIENILKPFGFNKLFYNDENIILGK